MICYVGVDLSEPPETDPYLGHDAVLGFMFIRRIPQCE